MRYLQLGTNGPRISVVGLACGAAGGTNADEASTAEVVAAALDSGLTFIDTTARPETRPQTEEAVGAALGRRRQSAVLCAAYGGAGGVGQTEPGRARYRYIRSSLESTLRRLRTDYVDVYQQYLPDNALPLEEMLYTLQRLIGEGKARAVGVARWETWRYLEACSIATMNGLAGFCSFQADGGMLDRLTETGLTAACDHYGTGLVATTPATELAEPARPGGRDLRELTLAGLVGRPGISAVLVPAVTARDVRNLASAAERARPDEETTVLETSVS